MRTIEIPDREKLYGRLMPRIWRVMSVHSTMMHEERRSLKRTVPRLVMIGEKVSRVRFCLGRAKRA